MKWSGKVKPGSITGVHVTGTDHYPTMLEVAGTSLLPIQHVDGHSYLRALQGETYQREPMFWYKWQARPDSTGDTRSISYVDGDYKIVQWIDEDLVELFDLRQDIREQNNLAKTLPNRIQTMLAKLLETESEIGNLREKGRKELERRLQKAADRKQQR